MSDKPQLFVCGATTTYRADGARWWKYDWLRRLFSSGSVAVPQKGKQ